MTIREFNLLEIDVYNGNDLVYTGMCEKVPEDLKDKQIKITGNEGKKLIVSITK